MTAKPILMWAVTGPKGQLLCATFDGTRSGAIRTFRFVYTDFSKPWTHFRQAGYRCVRVEVREVCDGG